MTAFQAQINYLPGASAPDEYNPANGRIPPADFVVTRRTDGSPLSFYADLTWDRTPYDPDGKPCVLNFQFWPKQEELSRQRQQLVEEMHWVMFILIWLRQGPSFSNRTLNQYVKNLRIIASYCEEKALRIQDILENPLLLGEVLYDADRAKSLSPWIRTMRKLGPDLVGFEAGKTGPNDELTRAINDYKSRTKQTSPIPTRIYSLILSVLAKEIKDWEAVLDRVLLLLEECMADPLTGSGQHRQSLLRKTLGQKFDEWRPGFPELLEKHGLSEFWANRGYETHRRSFLTALQDAQMVAVLQIQAFTGMRHDEAVHLPHYCLDEVDRDGIVHYIVKGRTTKLNNGKIKRTQWVTSASGRDAIRLAQRISQAIYVLRGDTLRREARRLNDCFLFIRPSYLLGMVAGSNKNLPTTLQLVQFPRLSSRLCPVIETEDVKELMQIDPHRGWTTEEEFKVGSPWNLTSHQFRRSLALYAQRSGLVSLPTLKRQLQHITHEMSLYYARGSAFSRDFIGDENEHPHFGEEWQETQPISQYFAYAKHVLFSEEQDLLYGGHVQFVNLRLRDKEGNVLHDREATLKRFKKGEIAWKPTPVGGCVNTAPCDKSPIDLLEVNCVANNCKNMVGNLKKTERVIQIKTAQLEAMRRINPASTELRQEEADLRMLTQGYERAKGWLEKSKEAA